MHKAGFATGLVLLFGISLVATNTWAVDVEGSFGGKIKCTVYVDDGSRVKVKQDLSVLVTQKDPVDGVSDLNVQFDFFPQLLSDATLFDDANKPDNKGAGAGVLCVNKGDANDTNAVFNFTVKKNGDKIKGTASFTQDGYNGTCKWNVTRSTITPPEVPDCED